MRVNDNVYRTPRALPGRGRMRQLSCETAGIIVIIVIVAIHRACGYADECEWQGKRLSLK